MDNELQKTLYGLIGENIKRARNEKALTQEKLAQQVGLTASSISYIEQGTQRVQLHDLYEIADVLSLEVFNLLPTSKAFRNAIPTLDKTIKELPSKEREMVESLRAKIKSDEEA